MIHSVCPKEIDTYLERKPCFSHDDFITLTSGLSFDSHIGVLHDVAHSSEIAFHSKNDIDFLFLRDNKRHMCLYKNIYDRYYVSAGKAYIYKKT